MRVILALTVVTGRLLDLLDGLVGVESGVLGLVILNLGSGHGQAFRWTHLLVELRRFLLSALSMANVVDLGLHVLLFASLVENVAYYN